MTWLIIITSLSLFSLQCDKEPDAPDNNGDIIQVRSARAGDQELKVGEHIDGVPTDKPFTLTFNKAIDTATAGEAIILSQHEQGLLEVSLTFAAGNTTIIIHPEQALEPDQDHTLEITEALRGIDNTVFSGVSYSFKTARKNLKLEAISLNGDNFMSHELRDVDFDIRIEAEFNAATEVPATGLSDHIRLEMAGENIPLDFDLGSGNKVITITASELEYYRPFHFTIGEAVGGENTTFGGFANSFYTRLDSTNKYPVISDEALLTKIQEQTFRYFWDYAHPASGMARERYGSGNVVTSGGSGFGIMAIIAGIERGFITRDEGLERLDKVVTFLEEAERFHGAWSHWINGETGEAIAFSPNDDGGDLVETAFLIQGLLTFRQYLDPAISDENQLISRIDTLWESVEWDWYTQGENVLYWHWSANNGFIMDMKIRGHNETLITYILAAASPTHTIDAEVYHEGYARNGGMINGSSFYDITLPLGYDYGGPLFFTHYSFLGLNPQGLQDDYANYWTQNVNHTLINRAHCIENPNNFVGYSSDAWGLTASDNHEGYSAHSPTNDLGVITPTAAISSLPYTPEASMDAIRHFYYKMGDRLWGEYGFYDAYNISENWVADSYLAIDQGPIILMIENHRTGLLWDLFMTHPHIDQGLQRLNFQHNK